MILGHQIELDPNDRQANCFARAAGCHRSAFNWGLNEWNRQYRAGGKPTAAKLKKQYNQIKEEQFPWVYESPKDANQEAFADLGQAWKNHFDSRSGKRKGPKVRRPKLKRKGDHDGFYLSNDRFKMDPGGRYVRLPKIGRVRIREPLRFEGKIMSARITRLADRWYMSINVEVGEVKRPSAHKVNASGKHEVLGIDLGIKTTVVMSEGEPIQAPKPLQKALKKLRRANRKLHRRVKTFRPADWLVYEQKQKKVS